MELNELRDKIHENAKAKGFYNVENSIINFGIGTLEEEYIRHSTFGQKIALIHSELSEALEADRKNIRANLKVVTRFTTECMKENSVHSFDEHWKIKFEQYVKNSIEDELADVIIRTLDLCGYLGIDIEKHVELKMKYNEKREYKHGKEY